MKLHQTLTTLLIVVISLSSFAQKDSTKSNWRLFPAKGEAIHNLEIKTSNELDYNNLNGKVNISEDPQIQALNSKIAESPFIYGYTIQLAVSQSKSTIQSARYKILKSHPKIELDDPYKEPNIYLYAGRFYDRASAYAFKKEISSKFPNCIVIGPKKMNLPNVNMPVETPTESDN